MNLAYGVPGLGMVNLATAKCVPVQTLPSGDDYDHHYPLTCACGTKLGGGTLVAAFSWAVPLACPHCCEALADDVAWKGGVQ